VTPIPIIDLFAGPGGLNEGFSQLGESDGAPVFTTIGSFEMESTAVRTLTLRAAYRHLLRSDGGVPQDYYSFIRGEIDLAAFKENPLVAEAFAAAETHVHQVELGGDADNSETIIRKALESAGVAHGEQPWVLIGGPPCQAYSLAGRSRRANDESFATDKKHFLYREYLQIIRTFAPPVFVMENVKGLLSSTTSGESMFDLIKRDLENPGVGLRYSIHSLTVANAPELLNPKDFVIRSEQYGIPQKRHRVILLGIRDGAFPENVPVGALEPSDSVTVEHALNGMPALRSGISPSGLDSDESWLSIRERGFGRTEQVGIKRSGRDATLHRGRPAMERTGDPKGPAAYRDWILDSRFDWVIQHESRSHMVKDLERYQFAAALAKKEGIAPKLRHFPAELLPNHKNAGSEARPFEDRFRVQIAGAPSTTVVSHISKDGHYYIHPDPEQMRSLTVREAARLQTFPDNYFFVGNRTQQYHQVGNAVPPLLANQIAKVVARLFELATRD